LLMAHNVSRRTSPIFEVCKKVAKSASDQGLCPAESGI
jgi:hypothetical protein